MTSLDKEIDANHERFFADWTAEASKNWASLKTHRAFKESYRRLSCLGALKRDLVVPNISQESAAFFHEAHNDALTSHVLAGAGAWRASLQSMRSCIENALCCLFYAEHPVELRQWATGDFRIGFSALLKYFERHPDLADVPPNQSGLSQLEEEYATLSMAVHGSAVNFRMTDAAAEVLLWKDDPARAGKWGARERKVLEGISLLLAYRFRSHLQGTSLPHVRNMLAYNISKAQQKSLKSLARVNI